MKPGVDPRQRLLAMLTHAEGVSEALASSEDPDALLRAFATACLDDTIDFCAVDLRSNGREARRIACALAADLGVPDAALVSTLAAMPSDKLGIVSHAIMPLHIDGKIAATVLFGSRRNDDLDDVVERARLADLVGRAARALQIAWLRVEGRTANRLRSEFLSIVSHELRTPLSTILGWSKLLREGGLNAERTAKGLEVIHRGAVAQSQIIDELLDASRVLGGELTLSCENASVGSLVDETIASFAESAAKKHVTIHVQPHEACVMKVDADRLEQLVCHLMSNAVKFTGVGGGIEVSLTSDDVHVVLTVADTGVGIDPAFLPEMFDRFRQADGAVTRRHGGMGLGLAIVRRIVEAHHGRVHAQSAGTGQGATFRVSLPRQPHANAELASPTVTDEAPTGTQDLRNRRVLVVDDERDVCEFTGTALTLRGALVTLAGSAAEALAALANNTFELLLSDIAMPTEDGVSLVRKALAAQPALRTVAFSALSQPADVRRAKAAGFERYLFKPLDPTLLVEELEELFGAPKESATSP